MEKKLSEKTWPEVQAEMSIAGSAEKIAAIGADLQAQIMAQLDKKCVSEIWNMQFALQKIVADLMVMEHKERKRQHP